MLPKLVQIVILKVGDRPNMFRSFIYRVKYTFLSWMWLVGGPVLWGGLWFGFPWVHHESDPVAD